MPDPVYRQRDPQNTPFYLCIEQAEVIRKILEHIGLWGVRRKPVPKANAPPVRYVAKDVEGDFPAVDDDVVDPIYPVEANF
jgi:hypothetical protein